MKIVTWNINGIRATKKSFKEILEKTNADVLCLQETKITRDQLESEIAIIDGYNSYFSFSEVRSGYSGVAVYCKDNYTPISAQAGLSNLYESKSGKGAVGCYGKLTTIFTQDRLKDLDREGRTLITQFELRSSKNETCKLTLINVYCPRADPEKEERKIFKLDFYKALEERAKALIESGSFVCIVGDINTSHKEIDHCDPNDPIVFYDNPCRVWLDSFLYKNGDYKDMAEEVSDTRNQILGLFVDSFRYFYPNKQNMFTCWCTTSRARETNYGTRIDYIFCDTKLVPRLKSCEILTEVYGSDHCPVEADVEAEVVGAKICPVLCSSYMPEFAGRQRKISHFVQKMQTVPSKTSTSETSLTKKRLLNESHPVSNLKNVKKRKTGQSTLTSFIKNKEVNSTKNNKVEEKVVPALHKSDVKPSNTNSKVGKPSDSKASQFWKSVLKGPEPPPLCAGHSEPSVLRTVKKDGPNLGRKFYCCGRPDGHSSNPEARCQFFVWVKNKK